MTGLYIHVPFCKSKCPYCDFYSLTDISLADRYTQAIKKRLEDYTSLNFGSLYFGGGTPSYLGARKLSEIIEKVRPQLEENAEMTVECNPSSANADFFKLLSLSGVNRISMGLQSAVDKERRKLGRISGGADVMNAVKYALDAGITNISLDIMLGVPEQTRESLKESIDFCAFSGAAHISAYMLKIEQGTRFQKMYSTLNLPDEDEVCDMYLQCVEDLSSCGFAQYEISNFALPGYEGRHNLNYWDCGEYLGLGPAAHSFLNKKRFYFNRDLQGFIDGASSVQDGDGGDFEEYAMLRLRLCEGLKNDMSQKRFGHSIPQSFYDRTEKYASHGFVIADKEGIRLTPNGFLISNSIISDILI